MIFRIHILCIYLLWLYFIVEGTCISCTTNDDTFTGNEKETLRGFVYIKLLQELFSSWKINLKDLAILTDAKGRDLGYSMLNYLGPDVQTLFKEKRDQNITDLLSEMIFYTDTNYFVFIASSNLYKDIIEQIVIYNLDLPCRVWIFISIEDLVPPEVCTFTPQSLNLYFIGAFQRHWNGQETEYTTTVEECHTNGRNYTLQKTIPFSLDFGIVNVQNISRIPSRELYLRIVGLHEPPFQYKVGNNFIGYNMDILDYISRSVGFKYRTLECDQNVYGYLNETTNKWSGCVSDIVYGRADLITVALHLMRSREAVIDYILPWTGYSGLTILAKQDQRQRFNFWNVFTPGLWLTLIAVFILSFLLLALFGKVLSRCHVSVDDNSKGSISEYNTFKRAFWFLTSSCAFEGTGEVPYGHSVRTVIASIWIFIQLFMSIFLGEVAAFLMSSGMKSQITSLDDLIEQHAINFSCLRDTSIGEHIYDMSKIENYFDKKWTRNNLDNEAFSSADKIVWTNPLTFKYTKLWERSVKTGFINTTGEAISKIKKGNFMLVSDSAVAEFVAGDDCDLKTIGRKISARPYGFAIRKHSSIKANISKALLELQHSTLMHEIRRRWWTIRKDCPTVGEDKGMSLSEMVGLFYVLLTGICISILVLVMEKVKNRRSGTFDVNRDNFD